MSRILLTLFIFGFTLGSGSCLASCGPLLISYLAGTGKNVRHAVLAYGIFSLSRLVVYLALGTAVFFLGRFLIARFLGTIARPVYLAGGGIIAIIGLFLVIGKRSERSFCEKMRAFLFRKDAKNIAVFGAIMGLLPCAPLLAVFAYITLVARTWVNAFIFTLIFGLGTIVSPLFLLAACTGFIPGAAGHRNLFGILGGGIMIFTGIQLFFKGIL